MFLKSINIWLKLYNILKLFLNPYFSHVCYAPELESVDDTRQKLLGRQREIAAKLIPPAISSRKRCHQPSSSAQSSTESVNNQASFAARDLHVETACSHIPITPSSSTVKHSKKIMSPVKRIVYHHSQKKPIEEPNLSRPTITSKKITKKNKLSSIVINCIFVTFFFPLAAEEKQQTWRRVKKK